MGGRSRSRSRSPRGDRHSRRRRSTSRDRDRRYERDGKHKRSHSRSPHRGMDYSRSRRDGDHSHSRDWSRERLHNRRPSSPHRRKSKDELASEKHNSDGRSKVESESELEDEESLLMKQMMGFNKFDTTKGKKVPGNSVSGVVKIREPKRFRQYMNRRGGFNRPLDPMK